MKTIFTLLALELSLSYVPALASAIMTVSGKLISITEKEFAVKTDGGTYYITKKAVPTAESSKITKTEVLVTFHVPFEGISRIKH